MFVETIKKFGRSLRLLPALAGLWALAMPNLLAQPQTPKNPRIRAQQDLHDVAVIGKLFGRSAVSDLHISLGDSDFLVTPTEDSKPFTILNYTGNWIEIELKNRAVPGTVSKIAYRYFSSERRLYQALLLNQVDFAYVSQEALALDVMRNNANCVPVAIAKKKNSIELIIYNVHNPVLRHREVRKAISYVINKRQIIEKLLFGKGEVAKGSVYEPDSDWFPKGGVETYNYNRRKAKQILRDAGWRDRDKDGVLEKNGTRLQIALGYRGGIELEKTLAREILLACNRIGIQINALALTQREMQDRLRNRQYEAVLLEQQFDEDIRALYDFFTNRKTSFIAFSTPAYERFYQLATKARTRQEKIALAKGMQVALNKSCAVSFLFFRWYDFFIVNKARLKNVHDLQRGQIRPPNEWQLIDSR